MCTLVINDYDIDPLSEKVMYGPGYQNHICLAKLRCVNCTTVLVTLIYPISLLIFMQAMLKLSLNQAPFSKVIGERIIKDA